MKHRKAKDKYEAIVDRMGAMADAEDRKIGSPSKIELSPFLLFADLEHAKCC